MKQVVWLAAAATAAGFAYWVWRWRRRWAERKRASEERYASFVAQAMVTAKPKKDELARPAVDVAVLARQKLLLEAAAKAAEAGEPVLSIQLYARLIARYPDTVFAPQARAAVEQQKKNLAKG
jgi:hypothetical protein